MNWTILNDAEARMIREGRWIHAIKNLRARTNCSLTEGKNVVDEYRRKFGLAGLGVLPCPVHDFIKVNSVSQDAVVCKACGAMYVRA